MKTIACIALHYGIEYLEWAVRSVRPVVDEVHVVYSPVPSFGRSTPERCPEDENVLATAVRRGCDYVPFVWHHGPAASEGEHRARFLDLAGRYGADVVVVLDADELWQPATLRRAVEQAAERPEAELRVRMIHFWRSLNWVCEDGAMPVRILRPAGDGVGYLEDQERPVLHMGYAQSERIVAYKWLIHGHLPELRPGWLEEKFLPWRPGCGIEDVHPTCADGFWTPRPVLAEEWELASQLLDGHPYQGLDWIP